MVAAFIVFAYPNTPPMKVVPVIVFEPATFPKKFKAETFPDVFTRTGELYVFAPMDKRFRGFELTIPTLPDVMKDVRPFVNWTVLEVVFPLFTTASRVVAMDEVVMELSLPLASMTN